MKSSYNIFEEMTFFLARYVLYLKRKKKKKLGLNSFFLSVSSDFLKSLFNFKRVLCLVQFFTFSSCFVRN